MRQQGWKQAVTVAIDTSDFSEARKELLLQLALKFAIPINNDAELMPLWKKFEHGHEIYLAEQEQRRVAEEMYKAAQKRKRIERERQQAEKKRRQARLARKRAERKKLRPEQSRIVRDVQMGLPTILEPLAPQMPFNLQKSERLVWFFHDTLYREERVLPPLKGGGQAGQYVMVDVETGTLGLTDKHIYFVGETERFRITYEKVIAFQEFEDGVGIQRDAIRARPQEFITDEGWFTYNLLITLAQDK